MPSRRRSRWALALLTLAILSIGGLGVAMTRPVFRNLSARALNKAAGMWHMVQAVYLKRHPEEGKRLYAGYCAGCHGPAGEGGRGPALTGRLRRAGDPFKLHDVISQGIPGTEMPASGWMITQRERWLLVAHTRSLSEVVASTAAGDAGRGRQLFAGKGGCFACHRVGSEGGTVGPDLTDVGSRRGTDYLRKIVLEPDAMPVKNLIPVRVITADGRRIEGMRVREDTFSIQVRELSGRFHSFWISDLKGLEKDAGKSMMPAYRKVFSDAECEDLVTYLASLRSE